MVCRIFANLTILAFFFVINLLKIVAANFQKIKIQRDLNLRRQNFSFNKMNSLAVVFEKPKKKAIANFVSFEPLWSLNMSFDRHAVCGKMLGI